MRWQRQLTLVMLALAPAAFCLAATDAATAPWQPAGTRQGVPLDWRGTAGEFRAYRGSVTVCAGLSDLEDFVLDADDFDAWIPYTLEARQLPSTGPGSLYYVKSDAPWPIRSRDMVYALSEPDLTETGVITIELEGRPDAVPERDDAVRMRSAQGRWTLAPGEQRIEVAFELAADPGPLPSFFTNRRIASMVAGTLANLADRFSCQR